MVTGFKFVVLYGNLLETSSPQIDEDHVQRHNELLQVIRGSPSEISKDD
jgi:hypothetical protein